ncbi:hypothetical protein DPMN_008797 [Dreissena polymorpha]|uniref:Uncharacterized protein n=1 Tax=Dreissena polymorpha TaxID=45954 RepID=A0A9D4MVT0_DREPO|nr:hypothetical protein DPMN_008797 [Dreissena polymorpha]
MSPCRWKDYMWKLVTMVTAVGCVHSGVAANIPTFNVTWKDDYPGWVVLEPKCEGLCKQFGSRMWRLIKIPTVCVILFQHGTVPIEGIPSSLFHYFVLTLISCFGLVSRTLLQACQMISQIGLMIIYIDQMLQPAIH